MISALRSLIMEVSGLYEARVPIQPVSASFRSSAVVRNMNGKNTSQNEAKLLPASVHGARY